MEMENNMSKKTKITTTIIVVVFLFALVFASIKLSGGDNERDIRLPGEYTTSHTDKSKDNVKADSSYFTLNS